MHICNTPQAHVPTYCVIYSIHRNLYRYVYNKRPAHMPTHFKYSFQMITLRYVCNAPPAHMPTVLPYILKISEKNPSRYTP